TGANEALVEAPGRGQTAAGYPADGRHQAIVLLLICLMTFVSFVEVHNSHPRANARLASAPTASHINGQPGADAVESVPSPLQCSMDQEPDLMGHSLRLHHLRCTKCCSSIQGHEHILGNSRIRTPRPPLLLPLLR